MRHVIGAPIRRPVHRPGFRRGMPDGYMNSGFSSPADHLLAACPFRRQRQKAHRFRPAFRRFHHPCPVRIPEVPAVLRAGPALRQERRFHMCAEHPGALRFRPVHHRPDPGQRPARILW